MSEVTLEDRVDFLEWLKTGSFRGVRLGMTRTECVERLGEPESWAVLQESDTPQNARIYLWSRFEFYFDVFGQTDPKLHRLETIYNDDSTTISELIKFINPNPKFHRIPPEILERFLRHNQVDFDKYSIGFDFSKNHIEHSKKFGYALRGPDHILKITLASGVYFDGSVDEFDKSPLLIDCVTQTLRPNPIIERYKGFEMRCTFTLIC